MSQKMSNFVLFGGRWSECWTGGMPNAFSGGMSTATVRFRAKYRKQEEAAMKACMWQQEAQLLLGDRATRKNAKDCWNGRGNDNLGWNEYDLQVYFKVIKSGTNRKLVFDFLLVVYSIFFAVSRTVFEKFDVKQSSDLEISPRSSTVASHESCRVAKAIYVNWSKDSERKKQKSPFSTTTLSRRNDAPSPRKWEPPRISAFQPYTAINYVPCATFFLLTVYG